jgi:putative DNA primase/helicase
MSDKPLYDSIGRDLSGGTIQSLDRRSQTLQDIYIHLEAGTTTTALSLIPALNELEYEKNRKQIAEAAGVRPAALDRLRKQAAKDENSNKLQGRALRLPEPVPAPEPQDGTKLLDDVAKQVRRFVVADQVSIDAITLWIVFAHIAQKAPCCPNLVFSSAVKACGKSTALDVVSRLVPKPLSVSNISVAALFRTVEMLSPTLLIDEADSIFRQNDDLRTLTNAGFTKTAAQVARTVGEDNEPRLFTVYVPKTIALIGTLPDTIESRSVIIRMRRRLPDEQIERLRSDKDQGFQPILARIARWATDNAERVLAQEPEIDPSLSDRQADVWRELLRIADFAGGEWPQRARIAALELCAKQSDEGDLSVRLLSDIQKIFAEQPERTKWPSQALVDELNAMDEAPWKEINHGRELTSNRLARMLARFEIRPETRKERNKSFKGYLTKPFDDAFSRYLQNNRGTVTSEVNYLQNSNLQGYDLVTVTDGIRNFETEGGTMAANESVESDGTPSKSEPTNETLEAIARVFSKLLETNREGLCVANWRLSCAAEGVPFEAFDVAKNYYNALAYYVTEHGVVKLVA